MIKQLVQKNKKDYLRSEKLNIREMKLYKRSLRKKNQDDNYRPGSVDWPYLKESFISNLNLEIHNRKLEEKFQSTNIIQQNCSLLDPTFEASTNKTSGSFLSSTHLLTQRQFSPPSIIFALGIKELEQPLSEAQQIGIPIIAVVDSNCDPSPNGKSFDYIIPGNDDSIRSYALYCNLISNSIREGHEEFTDLIYNEWLLKKS
jgi:hypothetical protein